MSVLLHTEFSRDRVRDDARNRIRVGDRVQTHDCDCDRHRVTI